MCLCLWTACSMRISKAKCGWPVQGNGMRSRSDDGVYVCVREREMVQVRV